MAKPDFAYKLTLNRRSPELALEWLELALVLPEEHENPDVCQRKHSAALEAARGLFVKRQMKLEDLRMLRIKVEKAAGSRTEAEVDYELFLEKLPESKPGTLSRLNPLKRLSDDKKREELLRKRAAPVIAARARCVEFEKEQAALEAEIAGLESGREKTLQEVQQLENRWIAAVASETLSRLASEGPDVAAVLLERRLSQDPRRIEFSFLLWLCRIVAGSISSNPGHLQSRAQNAIAEIRDAGVPELAAAMDACEPQEFKEAPPVLPSHIGPRLFALYSLCRVICGAPSPQGLEPPQLDALASLANLTAKAEKIAKKGDALGDFAEAARGAAQVFLGGEGDIPDSAFALAGHVHILSGASSDWIFFLENKSVALTQAHHHSLGILALAHKAAGKEVPAGLLDLFRRGKPDAFLWYTLSAVEGVPRQGASIDFPGGLFLIPESAAGR